MEDAAAIAAAETNFAFMEIIRESGNRRTGRALSPPRPAQTRPGRALTLGPAQAHRGADRSAAAHRPHRDCPARGDRTALSRSQPYRGQGTENVAWLAGHGGGAFAQREIAAAGR